MTFRQTLTYFYGFLRRKLFVALLLSLAASLLDGVGLALFLPLAHLAFGQAIDAAEGPALPGFVQQIAKVFPLAFNLQNLLVAVCLLFVLKSAFIYLKGVYDAHLTRTFMRHLRATLLEKFSAVRYGHFVHMDMGRLQQVMTMEVNKACAAFRECILCLQSALMVAVYLGFALYIQPITFGLVVGGGLVYYLLFRRVHLLNRNISRELVEGHSAYQELMMQLLNKFAYLKATATATTYTHKINERAQAVEDVQFSASKFHALTGALREPVFIVLVTAVVLLQTHLLDNAVAGAFVSLLFLYRAFGSISQLQRLYDQFSRNIGSVEAVQSLQRELADHREQGGKSTYTGLRDGLTLTGCTFSYPGRPVLHDLHLRLPKNRTLALVGASGSGKTTLAHVLSGLLRPQAGHYHIDDASIDTISTTSFRKRIGYVIQDAPVFNDSVFNNVTFWDERTSATESRFAWALEQACLRTFVTSLPNQHDTLLGFNGITLSGGLKQRLAIARELYKELDILILDEATSSLDTETEQAIQANIDALRGKLTIIIIAHRLSTVRNADEILLLENGRIQASGNFNALMDRSEKFRRMVDLQQIQ